MANVYDVDAGRLIEAAAKELASGVTAPDWAKFAKTGMSRERVPARNDWWQVRAASILRTIYCSHGPIGVQKLRVKYGSRKNRGHKPERFYQAGGKIIRLILQQLDKQGFTAQATIGVHKGRVITPKGKSFLDKIATQIHGPRRDKGKETAGAAPEAAGAERNPAASGSA